MNSTLKKLTKEELLVLFDWLSTNEEKEEIKFADLSELVVLDRIQTALEKALAEPFRSDYSKIVANARYKIRKEYEEKMGASSWIHEVYKQNQR